MVEGTGSVGSILGAVFQILTFARLGETKNRENPVFETKTLGMNKKCTKPSEFQMMDSSKNGRRP